MLNSKIKIIVFSDGIYLALCHDLDSEAVDAWKVFPGYPLKHEVDAR